MLFLNKIFYSMNDLAPLIQQSLKNGSKVKLTVTGNSMYPLFRNRRDIAILENVQNIKDVKKYDIVFYKRQNGQYVLHRVLKIHGEHLIIAGDNEVEREYAVNINQVFAKVTAFERNDKSHTTDELWYKIYVRLWNLLFPFRHIIILLWIKFRRLTNGKAKRE